MPNDNDNIIVIEEDNSTPLPTKQPKISKKNLIIIIALSVVAIALIVVLLILIFTKKEEETPEEPTAVENKVSIEHFQSRKLDAMIAKANALYENGNKNDALKIYKNISKYSESFSNYNLGVSRMKQENYEDALESFKNALANNENSTVSAINAAVCCLKLKKFDEFNSYIDLAYANVHEEKTSPLYNYYLALVNYYKGFYPEALQALSQEIHPLYENDAKYLQAKILTLLEQNQQAITKLNQQGSYEKNLSLAMLHSRNAEYTKAKFYINNLLEKKETNEAKLILALIDLKLGDYDQAVELLTHLNNKHSDYLKNHYNIKTVIDAKLFDINYAQENYEKNFLKNKERKYELIFYFSPFEVFNAKHVMSIINKANINVYLNDLELADSYLNNSSTLSQINAKLTKALEYAFDYNIDGASELLLSLVEQYPKHSSLQYNLALCYALLGKYDLAKKHFLASYHLNPKNLRSGIYALYCADILEEESSGIENELQESLNYIEDEDLKIYFQALLSIKRQDYIQLLRFANTKPKLNPHNLSLEIISYFAQGEDELTLEKAKLLIDITDNDIIANLLHFSLKNNTKNIKKYAKDVQFYFLNKKLDYRSLFGGAKIVHKNYVKLMQISGLLQQEREKLKELLSYKTNIGVLKALAYIDIYANEFEESFNIYNQLIDDYGVDDTETLFLASVAAIGFNQVNSAIALLELSRIKNPYNLDARLALAYLYHEVNNYESAISQYEKMNNGYISEFFTFELKEKN